jgi:hypothetical protein
MRRIRHPGAHYLYRFGKRRAALVFRSDSMTSTRRPCLSTARNRYFHWPPTLTEVSSTHQDSDRKPWYQWTRFLELRRRALTELTDQASNSRYPALSHHFLKVRVADAVFAVPTNAKQDDLGRKPAALEHLHRGDISKARLLAIQPGQTEPSARRSTGWRHRSRLRHHRANSSSPKRRQSSPPRRAP